MKKQQPVTVQEQGLIERCKRGEFSAFRELLERYQGRIYSVCYGVLRNREDAQDALQEVLIKLYHAIKDFKGESGLYVWMYRIAVNASLDLYRKRKRKREVVEETSEDEEQETGFLGISHETPADVTLQVEIKEVVHRAIHALPEKHKSIIILREIEGLSYQEIAKIMKCSVGTVMSRLFYARQHLSELLRPYMNEEEGAGHET